MKKHTCRQFTCVLNAFIYLGSWIFPNDGILRNHFEIWSQRNCYHLPVWILAPKCQQYFPENFPSFWWGNLHSTRRTLNHERFQIHFRSVAKNYNGKSFIYLWTLKYLMFIYFVYFQFYNSHDKLDRQIIALNQINKIESRKKRKCFALVKYRVCCHQGVNSQPWADIHSRVWYHSVIRLTRQTSIGHIEEMNDIDNQTCMECCHVCAA